MRKNNPGNDPRPARRPLAALAAILLSLPVAAGACGSSGDASPGVATLPTATSQPADGDTGTSAVEPDAVAYAQCMRDNGVPDFPDPDSDGRVLVDPEALEALGATPDSAVYQTCAPLLPNREEPDQADYEALLEFANCMRDEGITDFPDPNVGGGDQAPPDIDPESPQFQAAQEACRHLMPAGGVVVGS